MATTVTDYFEPDDVVTVRPAHNSTPLVAIEGSSDVVYVTAAVARTLAQGLLAAADEAEQKAGQL